MESKREGQKPEEAFFSIGVMARLLDVSTQRIRLIEKEGFLSPQRTSGKTRLYTQEDLEQARLVLTLMDELGVNAAGVEVILNMRQQMAHLQAQIQRLVGEMMGYVDKESILTTNALVPRKERPLTLLKILDQENQK